MRIKHYFIASLLAISITSLSATVYEDGENGTENWIVYDNKPTGATINNVHDTELNSNVINVEGTGRKNAYFIGAKKGDKAWNNSSEKYLTWDMNFNEKYKIKVYIKTALGKRTLYYDYNNNDKGLYKKTIIRLGLGRNTRKGKWIHIERDLEADLQKYEPSNSLTVVNGIKIQGSGKLDNIELKNSDETNQPIVISNINSQKISNTSVAISWKLSQYATGQIEYGETSSYGTFSKKESSTKYKSHKQKLRNLKENTLYHYRILAEDRAGNVVKSEDMTFTTGEEVDNGGFKFEKSDIIKIESIGKISKQELDLGDGVTVKKHCVQRYPEDEYDYTCNVIAIDQEEKIQDLTVKEGVFNIDKERGDWDIDDYDNASVNYSFYKKGDILYIFDKSYFSSDNAWGESDHTIGVILFDIKDTSNIKKIKSLYLYDGYRGSLTEENSMMALAYQYKDYDVRPKNQGSIKLVNLDSSEKMTYDRNLKFYFFPYNNRDGFKGVNNQYIVSGVASIGDYYADIDEGVMKKVFKLSANAISYVISTTTPYIYVLEEGNKIEVIHYKKDTKLHNEQIDSEGDYELTGTIPLDFEATIIAEKDGKILVYSETQSQYITIQ